MKNKQIMFFAMLSDIEPILKSIESLYNIQYFEMGLFDINQPSHYNTIFEINDLGFIKKGDWNYDRRLLITPNNYSLQIRDIPQKNGGIKYAIDPTVNPIGVCLQLGGVFKDNVLVAGKISIMSQENFALEIFKSYSSKIKKDFKKIEDFYLGKEAEEKLRLGWRLVLDEGREKKYDLNIKD